MRSRNRHRVALAASVVAAISVALSAFGCSPRAPIDGTSLPGPMTVSGAGPTPTPVASATATPKPTPTPSPTPSGRYALSIEITPATATIYAAPPRGAMPQHPYTVQLAAKVKFNDGAEETAVNWLTGEGDRALVSDTGLVSSGVETGAVNIFAISKDGYAKAFATITVKNDAGIEVGID